MWASRKARPPKITVPQPLIQIVDAALAAAYQRGGHHLVCHPGCYQCCIGVFPIAHEDAARLREGLATLNKIPPKPPASKPASPNP